MAASETKGEHPLDVFTPEAFLGEQKLKDWYDLASNLEMEQHEQKKISLMKQRGRMHTDLQRLEVEMPEVKQAIGSSRCHVVMMEALREGAEVGSLGLAVVAGKNTFRVRMLNKELPEGARARVVLVEKWVGEDGPKFYGEEWEEEKDPKIARMAAGVGLQAMEVLAFLTENPETDDFNKFVDAVLREYPVEEGKKE